MPSAARLQPFQYKWQVSRILHKMLVLWRSVLWQGKSLRRLRVYSTTGSQDIGLCRSEFNSSASSSRLFFFCPLTLALSLWHKRPTRNQAASFFGSLSHTRLDTHTQTHTPVRTPLNDSLSCNRGRYLLHNGQQTQRKNIHARKRIRTHSPSKQAASDVALHRTATGVGCITTARNKSALLTATSNILVSSSSCGCFAKTGNERRSVVGIISVRVLSIITILILMKYYVNIRPMTVLISSYLLMLY